MTEKELLESCKLLCEAHNQLSNIYDKSCLNDFGYIESVTKGLFSFARFKEGNRVELIDTPRIDQTVRPGWMSYKHFLVKGARGKVHTIHWYDKFVYGIQFDKEHYVNSAGVKEFTPINRRSIYSFNSDFLKKI